jgi:hypothetical protein
LPAVEVDPPLPPVEVPDPDVPELEEVPEVPELEEVPDPDVPELEEVPEVPELEEVPDPDVPELEEELSQTVVAWVRSACACALSVSALCWSEVRAAWSAAIVDSFDPDWAEVLGRVVEVVVEGSEVPLVSLATAVSSVSSAALTVDSSPSTSEVSEEVSRVARTCPSLTCCPSDTETLATWPATWNERSEVFTGWRVPEVSIVCCTFPIAAVAVR